MTKTVLFCFALSLSIYSSSAMTLTLTGGFPETLSGTDATVSGRFMGDSRFVNFVSCFLDKSALTINWQAYPPARLIRLVERGEVDISFPMGFNPKRAATSIQSIEAGIVHSYLVYVGPRPDFDDKSLKIGTKRGTPQISYLESIGFKSIQKNNNYFPLFKMLINGRLDMIAVPSIVYDFYVAEMGDKLNFQIYKTYHYGFYLKPKMDKTLIRLINDSIIACSPEIRESDFTAKVNTEQRFTQLDEHSG